MRNTIVADRAGISSCNRNLNKCISHIICQRGDEDNERVSYNSKRSLGLGYISTVARLWLDSRLGFSHVRHARRRCRAMLYFPFFLGWILLSSLVFGAQEQEDSSSSSSSSSTFPVRVELPGLGIVQGVRRFSEEYVVDFFGGIPYAAPPVMNLRWSPPQEAVQWHPHVLDASDFGADCFQVIDPVMNPYAHKDRMSEDCLTINFFRPAITPENSNEKLPVMLWFHGGAFQQGGSNRPEYNARRLAHEEHVMVVTVNYRLGALGFLVSRELGLTGNYGLMDQRAAMNFVKQYCAYFGGDPDNITLFGESAGAVMIGLHLLMDNNVDDDFVDEFGQSVDGRLFHKAILQSNPMGYQFRSPNVADFLGDALRRAVDCRDLECMYTESVEEILRAQSSLMGIPRSVGDFFAWGPTLTTATLSATSKSPRATKSTFTSSSLFDSVGSRMSSRMNPRDRGYSSNDEKDFSQNSRNQWASVSPFSSSSSQYQRRRRRRRNRVNMFDVNVTQPLQNLHLVPDDIPIVIGTNKNEGEMFVHSAFPLTMSKAVYWMFVGALFKDSAPKVLKHYRPYVKDLESGADSLAKQQIQEEKNKQYFVENQSQLEEEYENLLQRTGTVKASDDFPIRGGSQEEQIPSSEIINNNDTVKNWWGPQLQRVQNWTNQTRTRLFSQPDPEEIEARRLQREELAKQRAKEKAIKEAAKVAIDYRPVMSRIINDYLFRCPSWHYAHLLSLQRVKRFKKRQEKKEGDLQSRMYQSKRTPYYMDEGESAYKDNEKGYRNNVFVYRFSQPTHVPGYLECWGKSCHTAELPFVFEAMDIIRTDYSTLSSIAQEEAPVPPEYPYTDLLAAYRGAMEETSENREARSEHSQEGASLSSRLSNYTSYFQRVLDHFFADYFKEDADEAIAHDMAQRWVAFARTGSPNYDDSKEEWVPWRFVPDDDINDYYSQDSPASLEERQLYIAWRNIEEDSFDSMERDNSHVYTEDEQQEFIEKAYRKRALEILNMEEVEKDTLRTELKRNKQLKTPEAGPYAFSTFGRQTTSGVNSTFQTSSDVEDDGALVASDRMIQLVQRMAQDMSVLGRGLSGEYDRLLTGNLGSNWNVGNGFRSGHEYWDDDFFPQLLELKWPPENRLVERDCSCDFWERIRYRY